MIHSLLFAVQVFINGQPIEAIETNGTLYVPVEAVAKALGATVTVQTNEAPPVAVAPVAEPAAAKPPAPSTTVRLTTPPPVERPGAVQGKLQYQRNVTDLRGIDAGAEVWLVPASKVAELAAAAGGTEKEPIPANVAGFEKKLTEQFGFRHAVADAQGEFEFAFVAPGEYTVILLSRNAGGLARRDNHGKMRFVQVRVREGLSSFVKFNFGVSSWWAEDKSRVSETPRAPGGK
jgi:hypothetical protein